MSGLDIYRELEPLFNPQSVAVIGATNNMTKWGFSTFTSIKGTYKGALYAVNNRADEVLGYPAYAGVKDIPGPVDLAVIVVPADRVAQVMKECVSKGVKASVIISAGFAETGSAGKAMQDEVVAIARKGGIRIVGPNCMGMWSACAELPAFMFPLPVKKGPLALISQGGNVGGSLVVDAVMRGVGFEQYVSCGCTADIQIEDYIEYAGKDDNVKVIMVYIEGLNDGHRFVEKVKPVSAVKPVVALKPGKTTAAAKAISSHSGALSGTDSVYEAAFKKAGVIRTESAMELLDVAMGFLAQPLPRGRNVVIITPGGSYGVMCADACASRGLNVIDLPSSAMDAFNSMFPSRWSHGNPVDPAGDRNLITYLRAPEIILGSPEVHALIFMGFGSFSGISALLASAGEDLKKSMEKLSTQGISEIAGRFSEMLGSGDGDKIRQAIRSGLGIMLGAVSKAKEGDMDLFTEMVIEAVSTGGVIERKFLDGMKDIFDSASSGTIDGARMAYIVQMLEPLLSALISHWINKYDKPVITTTFMEEQSRAGISGHYSYSNADRAADVLAKLVEYSEYVQSLEI